MVDATALAGKHYELRDKYGETISDGRISKKPDEIMVNRGVGQRLFVRDTPEDEWEEVGASAGPSSVEGQTYLDADSGKVMEYRDGRWAEVVCRCGNDALSCVCGVPTEDLEAVPTEAPRMPTASSGDASAPPKQESGTGGPTWNTEAWKTPPAREPIEDIVGMSDNPWKARQLRLVKDNYNAPGEHGHYSRLTPQPVDVIEAWNLNHHEAEALAHLARWRYDDHPKEDLEKAVWWIQRLIEFKFGSKSL